MISIIIPLYNKEKYIEKTLKSVFQQTFKDFEVIIIDDGSTDKSLAIVESFSDDRLSIFSIPNSGVSKARNLGINKAKSEYVAFLDADDYWEKSFLSEIKTLIEIYPKEKVFATGRISLFKDTKIEYQNKFLPQKNKIGIVDYIKVISKYLPPVNSSNSVFKKQALIDAGLFKPGQKQHEDHDLWLRVCKSHNVVYVNKPLSYYRKDIKNSGSQSQIRFFDFYFFLKTILEVKNSLDQHRNDYFKAYYNKFILFTFIKYQKGFSKDAIIELFDLFKQIVSPFYLYQLYLVNKITPGLTYKLISKVRNK